MKKSKKNQIGIKKLSHTKTGNVYVVRKYVLAHSAQDAIKKEKKTNVHDVWLDDKVNTQLASQIGFVMSTPYEEEN